ncbi:DPB2 (YPR175W) [Zygosaccharomyces parabailii]|nr:DPB2 (YPR175W) [Zygosaccharomyces parabailii]CDH10550.1 probable DNA polymerase epsilon subunit B [Zygosaccharomyces bailii ISA1307]
MLTSGNVLPVKISPPLLRPMAYRVLSKKYGLNIKSDGLGALSEFVGNTFGMDWKRSSDTLQFLENFACVWRQQERSLFVDRQGALEVIDEIKERNKIARDERSKPLNKVKNASIDKFLQPKSEISAADDHSSSSPPAMGTPEVEEGATSAGEQKEDYLDWKEYFKIVNASDQLKFKYDPVKMQLVPEPDRKEEANIFNLPALHSYLSLFRTRYYLVRDRVMRNENFQNSDSFNPLSSMVAMQQQLQSDEQPLASQSMTITHIKNLIGRDGQNFLLLGLLRINSKGNWSLEDPSGTVEIDISQAIPTTGSYYVPGNFLLAEGIYFTAGNRFHVSSMTHPPGERRQTTLSAIGNLDLLGVHSSPHSGYVPRLDKDLKIRLHLLEKELIDHRFVILGGDIFLDHLATMEALDKVFTRLDEDPPILIVFQGSFSSVPVHASLSSKTTTLSSHYKNNFDTLATMLARYENISEHSMLVFVPGVNDPWKSMISRGAAYAWPQNPVPSFFTQKIDKVCKNVIWASNPTKIAYVSQEICIARDDLSQRLKRHQVEFPSLEEAKQQELNDLKEQFQAQMTIDSTSIHELFKSKDQLPAKVKESRKVVKTLLDQGHLSPFATDIRPVVWDLDHALTLYPIPSALVLCDTTTSAFDLTYNGCKTVNPGKFISGRRLRYMEYRPASKKNTQEEIYF